jgi:hypothetical protein
MKTKKDIELRQLKRQFIREYCQVKIPIWLDQYLF